MVTLHEAARAFLVANGLVEHADRLLGCLLPPGYGARAGRSSGRHADGPHARPAPGLEGRCSPCRLMRTLSLPAGASIDV
jgi:hypothetical protein